MKISHRGKASKKPMRNGFAAVTVALLSSGRGGPLNGREGRFVLKYFRVGGSKRHPLRPRKWRQG
jgi:hypothetical protein